MGVEVDWARIVAVAKKMGWDGEYVLALTTTRPYAVEVLNEALSLDDEQCPANGGWYPSPTGWLVEAEGEMLPQLQPWVVRWAAALTAAGVDGTITGPSLAPRQSWAKHIEMLMPYTGYLRYLPDDTADAWRLPWPADSHAGIVDHLVDWSCAAGGSPMVYLGPGANVWAGPEAIKAIMNVAQASGRVSSSSCYDRPTQRIRCVATNLPGTAMFFEQRVGAEWAEQVQVLRAGLLGAPRERLAHAAVGLSDDLNDARQHWYLRHPQVWGELVLKPYGLQILTAAHVEAAHDLSGWQVTRLDEGHFLVEDRDLGAWYAATMPFPGAFDEHLMARAVADFGAMIVTLEQAGLPGAGSDVRKSWP